MGRGHNGKEGGIRKTWFDLYLSSLSKDMRFDSFGHGSGKGKQTERILSALWSTCRTNAIAAREHVIMKEDFDSDGATGSFVGDKSLLKELRRRVKDSWIVVALDWIVPLGMIVLAILCWIELDRLEKQLDKASLSTVSMDNVDVPVEKTVDFSE